MNEAPCALPKKPADRRPATLVQAHAYRTEDYEGVKDFARGCMKTYLILKEKARRWHEDTEIQALLAEIAAVLPNESLIVLERTKRFTPDILLTYLVNPGTALYVGYTDRYENALINPGLFRRTGSPISPTDRQFFLKMSYLLSY